MTEAPRIVASGETDEQRAEKVRAELAAALAPVAAVMTAAGRQGLRVSFTLNPDGFGRFVVPAIEVVKVL